MNILLTHGYFLHEDPRERIIMKPYPPLGLLYISAWLDRHAVDHQVYDTTFSRKEDFFIFLENNKPQLLALYVNLMTKLNVLEVIRFVRDHPALRSCTILLGGPDVSYNTFEYLRAGADAIAIGEGEQTALELALSLRQSPDRLRWQSIPGLAFLLPDGSEFRSLPREKIREADQLPIPARHRIPMQAYLDAWKNAHGYSSISVSTERGCPYTCRWCSTAVYGQSYRRRSPENVVREIRQLQQQYDFDNLWFVDDVFTISHRWLEAFCEALEREEVRIRYECITRADRMNEHVVALLKRSGCFRVWIGAESGSQRIIDAMDRRVAVGQVREMIRAARTAGMEAGTFIMLGYPGETEKDVIETANHLKAANPDLFTITVAYPIKGTGLYEEVEQDIQTALPWEARTDRDLDFRRTYPRPYYDYAVRWMVNSVNGYKARQSDPVRSLKHFGKAGLARLGMWWWRRRPVFNGRVPANLPQKRG